MTTCAFLAATAASAGPASPSQETRAQYERRMKWWKEARFGMFIHWGLYSTTDGVWGDRNGYGEWLLDSARIPVDEYQTLRSRFNPTRFDADEWARLAKRAGMRYVVFTTKHHDGFCLWDSDLTDYDVMSTPFRRDVAKELAEACRRQGIRVCWYHSVMDWHHDDYLPRRSWESRAADGADFARYVDYLRGQVTELLTRYGDIGAMWFDGQWESTWTHEHGKALYDLCRTLQPRIIVNNRVDKGSGGMAGDREMKRFVGDFGTPEQTIPDNAIPGVNWETCLTMNRHWGWNAADREWKSSADLIRSLADIASKGGNLLLNVGPMGDGSFPPASVERLEAIGRWMDVNSESIYGTDASPFSGLKWGRCTRKTMSNGRTRLYLHIFDWPQDGILRLEPLLNRVVTAKLLAAPSRPIGVMRDGAATVFSGLGPIPDEADSVLAVDIEGPPMVPEKPRVRVAGRVLEADEWHFLDTATVAPGPPWPGVTVRYTLDGSQPTARSPVLQGGIKVTKSATLRLRSFLSDRPVGETRAVALRREKPLPAGKAAVLPGLAYRYFEGEWQSVPASSSRPAQAEGVVDHVSLAPRKRDERFALWFDGYVNVPRSGVYVFATESDDGSVLVVDGRKVVDNDGMHESRRATGVVALGKGLHRLAVGYVQGTGGYDLAVYWAPRGGELVPLPPSALFRPSRPESGNL
jgi:alpha-L-fucosidase